MLIETTILKGAEFFMIYDIPHDNKTQDLIFKTVGGCSLELTFLPPLLEIYEAAPIYFIITGGGWFEESRAAMLGFSADSVQELRNKGFAVVSPDYRTYAQAGVKMEDIISDCFDAVRYISHFSDVLKVDPKKFFVSGHSAGGHLALMLAYAPGEMFRNDSTLSDDYKVIAAAPISAPTLLYSNTKMPRTLNFDVMNEKVCFGTEDIRKKNSPYTYVSSHCPPTILFAGTSDNLVYYDSSVLLYNKLLDGNVRCELVLSEGGGHCFEPIDNAVPSVTFEDVQKKIVQFCVDILSDKQESDQSF